MELVRRTETQITPELIDSILSMPLLREVVHCGQTFTVSPFEFYATCPTCRTGIKVRSFSANVEIEDVFDAVFEWMNQAGAEALVRERQRVIAEDSE